MKKLLLLYALLIFACSSDDSSNDDNIQNNSIIIDGSETILNSASFYTNLVSQEGNISFISSAVGSNSDCYFNLSGSDWVTDDEFVYIYLGYLGPISPLSGGIYTTAPDDWSDGDGTTRFDVGIFYQGEYIGEEEDDPTITGIINITRNTPSTNINPYANYTISWEFIGPNGETITGYYNGDIYMCIN